MRSPSRDRRRTRLARAVCRTAAAALLFALALASVPASAAGERISRVAVFPVENLSGGSVPSAEVRQFLIARLSSRGIAVLDDGRLDGFMTRHRVRYTAGIDAATGASLRQETGVEGIVIASIDLASEEIPPGSPPSSGSSRLPGLPPSSGRTTPDCRGTIIRACSISASSTTTTR